MPSRTSNPNTLVVTIEGMGTSLIGAYGGSIANTPTLDQLASRGIILDQCFLDSLKVPEQLASLWSGQHSVQRRLSQVKPSSPDITIDQGLPSEGIWERCHQSGVDCCLITDSESIAQQAEQWGCADAFFVPPGSNQSPASEVSLCNLMNLFTAACELLATRCGLVWIHSSGLELPWDAPIDFRAEFADPEDPPPPAAVGPPEIELSADTDPDLINGWAQVATAQAAVVDEGLACLAATLATRSDSSRWGWLVSSLGGVALGEHAFLGTLQRHLLLDKIRSSALYAEMLSCVAILVPSGGTPIAQRRGELFQLPDLGATIAGLCGFDPAEQLQNTALPTWGVDIQKLAWSDGPQRWPAELQLAALKSEELAWIRCPAWSAQLAIQAESKEDIGNTPGAASDDVAADSSIARLEAMEELETRFQTRLFVKPEDRWEVNDVADRRIDIAEQLKSLMGIFEQAVSSGRRGQWNHLPDELLNLLR